MQLNMERVKGGGLLKYVEGPTDVVCGVVFMMVGRVSPNMWPYWWVMALVFFFGMISGLEITHLKGSILSCMLESTDAAPEVPHPRPTLLPACLSASAFFFFFFSRIRADTA